MVNLKIVRLSHLHSNSWNLELTQIEDPREQWRREQERMLKEYLVVAQEALNAKKEIYQIKQQRFELAQEEYQQLHRMCEDDSRSHASCELIVLWLPCLA